MKPNLPAMVKIVTEIFEKGGVVFAYDKENKESQIFLRDMCRKCTKRIVMDVFTKAFIDAKVEIDCSCRPEKNGSIPSPYV